jgi:hypothetical protein
MKTPFAFLLICLACSISACKKKQVPVEALDTNPEVKAHFNFQPGTYWIYWDSVSKRTDSFYVTSNTYSKQNDPTVVLTYHYLTIAEVTEDTASAAIADSAKWVFDFERNKIIADYYYYYTDDKWKNDVGYSPLFTYPFSTGSMNGEYTLSTVTAIDSVDSVKHVPYFNVARVHQFLDADSTAKFGITKIDDWFYINDSIGIIRMDLSHPYHALSHKWYLLRYNIVK